MLMNRIIGALTFRQGVYDEVENDPAFTSSAWMIVAAVAFLSQLGANAAVLQWGTAWGDSLILTTEADRL